MKPRKQTIIHVNQHNIKANAKGGNAPVLTVKDYKQNRKGFRAVVLDKDGVSVGEFVYRPDKPLNCGAKVWFQTKNEVLVYE